MKFNKLFGRFGKDEKAFTGLESAIVLTAFIVVAAVFSYVVLGAGFSTSDTAKATVDEGIKQATSSIELAGDVYANSSDDANVSYIIATIQLTAGQEPVDIGEDSTKEKLVISYHDESIYVSNLTWSKKFVGEHDDDDILEQHEKVQINIQTDSSSKMQKNPENVEFTLEIKPKVGAILPITRTIPPEVDTYMRLV